MKNLFSAEKNLHQPTAVSETIALSIKSSSSITLRKLSSRLPSSQVILPCQLVFCRNKTFSEKVARFPLREAALLNPSEAMFGFSAKERTAEKD